MRKTILFFCLITLLKSNTYSQDTASSRFMPLSIGNKWVYNCVHGSPGYTYNFISKIKVVSDTIISSQRYFKISGNPFSYSDSTYTFVRYDPASGKLVKFMNSGFCNNAYTYAKLSSVYLDTTGNCFAIENFICNRVQDSVLFNLNTVYKSFYFNETGHIDRSTWIAFAKYLGLEFFSVSSASGSGYGYQTQRLKGCVINGIVYGDTTTSVIGIHQTSTETPQYFSLSQNYPNPFNPTTKIRFEIPLLRGVSASGGRGVSLVIYDLLGREVATLVNEELKPGTYEVDWDAAKYPSGVYFYRIISLDFTETKRMVLIK